MNQWWVDTPKKAWRSYWLERLFPPTDLRSKKEWLYDKTSWKYHKLEQQERAREMSKCKHKWKFTKLNLGHEEVYDEVLRLNKLDEPNIVLECEKCKRKVSIDIERLINSGYAKTEKEGAQKGNRSLRGILDLLMPLTDSKVDVGDWLISEAIANISDRLDELEGK